MYHVYNIQYLYLLIKCIKYNFRGYRCGTTPVGVVRRQRELPRVDRALALHRYPSKKIMQNFCVGSEQSPRKKKRQ